MAPDGPRGTSDGDPLPMVRGPRAPIILDELACRDQRGSGHDDRRLNATDGLSSAMGGGEAAPAVAWGGSTGPAASGA